MKKHASEQLANYRILDRLMVTIRAAPSSYVILGGGWVILSAVYLSLSLTNPASGAEVGAAIAGGGAVLWWIWLYGFKISVTESALEYRDGLYRTSRVALSEIARLKYATIQWCVFGQKICVPRLLVISRSNKRILKINPKPFGRLDLSRLQLAVKGSGAKGASDDGC